MFLSSVSSRCSCINHKTLSASGTTLSAEVQETTRDSAHLGLGTRRHYENWPRLISGECSEPFNSGVASTDSPDDGRMCFGRTNSGQGLQSSQKIANNWRQSEMS